MQSAVLHFSVATLDPGHLPDLSSQILARNLIPPPQVAVHCDQRAHSNHFGSVCNREISTIFSQSSLTSFENNYNPSDIRDANAVRRLS